MADGEDRAERAAARNRLLRARGRAQRRRHRRRRGHLVQNLTCADRHHGRRDGNRPDRGHANRVGVATAARELVVRVRATNRYARGLPGATPGRARGGDRGRVRSAPATRRRDSLQARRRELGRPKPRRRRRLPNCLAAARRHGRSHRVVPTGATISSVLNPTGFDTSWYVEYGATTQYGLRTAAQPAGAGTADVAVGGD